MYENEVDYTPKQKPKSPLLEHYYGDVVRSCFIAAGFMLLGAVLVDAELFTFYILFGTFGVLLLIILAGLTTPRSTKVLRIEAMVAGVGFIVFEYFAASAFLARQTLTDPIFLLRQILAILFLVALYYSVKSIRWMLQLHIKD